ncbi:MAG: hypothetical protein AB7F91_14480 [Parvularculaceae bacterium]
MRTTQKFRDDYAFQKAMAMADRFDAELHAARDISAVRERILQIAVHHLPDDYEVDDKTDDELRRDTLIAAGRSASVFASNSAELRTAFEELAAEPTKAGDNGRSAYLQKLHDASRNGGA